DLRPPPGHSVVVGIGSPQRDVDGIGVTLAEARQAAVVAASSPKPVSVRVLQELGPSRLLLGWYSSEAFADYAREMLGPLLDSDDPELIRTLEAYLERACSTAQTARALGVHRNTVAQRIARAERVLGATTATSDTRLALQLAIRVLRTRSE
ncbi:MAG: PucR family transcriptional regulator, partial [Pseudonocardia sp.]